MAKNACKTMLMKIFKISNFQPKSAPKPIAMSVSPSPKALVFTVIVPMCAKVSNIKYPAIIPKILCTIEIEPRFKMLYKSPKPIKM